MREESCDLRREESWVRASSRKSGMRRLAGGPVRSAWIEATASAVMVRNWRREDSERWVRVVRRLDSGPRSLVNVTL